MVVLCFVVVDTLQYLNAKFPLTDKCVATHVTESVNDASVFGSVPFICFHETPTMHHRTYNATGFSLRHNVASDGGSCCDLK